MIRNGSLLLFVVSSLLIYSSYTAVCQTADETLKFRSDWQEVSGNWEIKGTAICPVSAVQRKGSPYILTRRDMESGSRWENLQLEILFDEHESDLSAGFALNTFSQDNFGFLRIRQSGDKSFLQAGIWKHKAFRTSLNIELEETLQADKWYLLKIIPTVNRSEYRCWTIILAEKEGGRIIAEHGILNQLPLFGRGVPGIFADDSHVALQNFLIEKTLPGYQTSHLTVAPLFSDGMVLQRRSSVPVWGRGEPGVEVKIHFNKKEYIDRIGQSGRWKVVLPPMEASDSERMKIISSADTILLQDIAIGEVWLASGQSNMNMMVWQSDVLDFAKGREPDSGLRMFDQPKWPSEEPLFDNGGSWTYAVPQKVEKWSAVAYSYAVQLREQLQVPVGIIWSCWGGTTVESWFPKEDLKVDSLAKPIFDQYIGAKEALEKGEKFVGVRPYNVPGQHKSPGALFNGMIYPHIPYAIRGVIWYQGESNTNRARQYESLFPMLINSWRRLWNNSDLYFAFVQLAGYDGGQSGAEIEDAWPQLREAQRVTLQKVSHAGMAVTTDLGHETNIHPRGKLEVGKRLARLALHDVYGFKDLVRCGPLYESIVFTGNHAKIRFSEIGAGLEISDGQLLQGFEIAGEDHKFYPAQGEIPSDDKQVNVWSEFVNQPVAVRYAWKNHPVDANLVNSEGLPASPFRTDDWPLPTDDNR